MQKILGHLKVRPTPMNKWILHTMNVETLDHSSETWIGEAISNGMRRHQNTKRFNYGKIGYLRRDCRQVSPRNHVSFGNDKNRRTQPSGKCGRYDKGQHWTNKCRSTKERQDNLIPSGISFGGPLADTHDKCGPIIPNYCGKCISMKIKKSSAYCKKPYWSEWWNRCGRWVKHSSRT